VADLEGSCSAGAAVEVTDATGRYLGRGFYSPRSSLVCRLLTRADEAVNAGLIRRRLEAALEWRRAASLVTPAYRLCWSEADGLPGLVVDRYGPVSVIQCLTLGMARNADWIREALTAMFPEAAFCASTIRPRRASRVSTRFAKPRPRPSSPAAS